MIRKSVFLLYLLQGVLSEWSMRALPQRAISKSCVVIPCTFDFPSHPHTAIHGAWFKYWYYWKYTVYYSKDPNYGMSDFKGRAKIIGNLGKKDCSLRIDNVRPEDSDVYYFYVELDGFTTHTYTSPIQLQVLEVPDRPEILLPGNLTEGTPVTIVCKAIYTCPENRPSLTWSELPNSTVNVFAENSSGEISSVLAFTPSFVHHSGTVRCTVDYSGTSHRLENSVTLNVTYSPKKTVVQWTLNKDNGISLSCSSEANPNVTHFSWFKTSGGAETELRQYGDTITVAFGSEEEAVSFYCRATNAVGSSRSPSVRIPNQREAAILPSSQCTRYPTNVTCHCMVQSSFPVNVSWGFLGQTVQNSETEGGYLTQCVRAGILVTNTLTIRGDNLTLETVSCSVANPRGLPPSQMKLEVVADDGQGHGSPTGPEVSWSIQITPLVAGVGAVALIVLFVIICVMVKKRGSVVRSSPEAEDTTEMGARKETMKVKKCQSVYLAQTASAKERTMKDPGDRSHKLQNQRHDIYENYDMDRDNLYANVD